LFYSVLECESARAFCYCCCCLYCCWWWGLCCCWWFRLECCLERLLC